MYPGEFSTQTGVMTNGQLHLHADFDDFDESLSDLL